MIGKTPGTRIDEAILHRRLSASHSHGEWFWPSDDIKALLVEKCGRLPAKYSGARHAKPLSGERTYHDALCVLCEEEAKTLMVGFCHACARRLVAAHESSIQAEVMREEAIARQMEQATRALQEARARRQAANKRLDDVRPARKPWTRRKV